jgi:hypothetical protein
MDKPVKTMEKPLEATKVQGRGLGSGVGEQGLKNDLNATDGVLVNQNTTPVAPQKDNRRHPDTAIAQTVANMAFAGQTQDTICRVLKMSMSTLYEHYKHELDTGQASMVNQISTSLAQRAMGGSDTAAIFLLKTRGGGKFTERTNVELTGKDGGPIEIAQRTEVVGKLVGQIAKGITIEGEAHEVE